MTDPFLTLADETDLIHSKMGSDGQVRVDIEQPDAQLCFKTASCWLPGYTWENVVEFSQDEMAKFQEVIESCAHLIIEFAQTGGFEHASFFRIGLYWNGNTPNNAAKVVLGAFSKGKTQRSRLYR